MTGWRIGYAAGPVELIKSMSKIQSQSTSNPCSISQYAAIEALNGNQNFIQENNKIFKSRRDLALNILNQSEGISCEIPEGSFYLFPSCINLIGKKSLCGQIIKNDQDFANELLKHAKVAVVPGSAFGYKNYFRISYATSTKNLNKACLRIKNFCQKLIKI